LRRVSTRGVRPLMKTVESKACKPPSDLAPDHDVIVRMPPKRRYAVRVQIERVRKATPRVREPEGA